MAWALGIQSGKVPSIDIFGLQHLVVEGLLNFGHNAPSSGRFYKLTKPLARIIGWQPMGKGSLIELLLLTEKKNDIGENTPRQKTVSQ